MSLWVCQIETSKILWDLSPDTDCTEPIRNNLRNSQRWSWQYVCLLQQPECEAIPSFKSEPVQNWKCDTTGAVPHFDAWKYKHGVKCNTFTLLTRFKGKFGNINRTGAIQQLAKTSRIAEHHAMPQFSVHFRSLWIIYYDEKGQSSRSLVKACDFTQFSCETLWDVIALWG